MSFLKYIIKDGSEIPSSWLVNPESAFSQSTLDDQAYFLLNQSIIINYLTRLYGVKGLPILINQFKEYLINWYREDFAEKCKIKGTPYSQMALPCIDSLLGVSLNKLQAASCLRLLSQPKDVPMALDESFYVTYVTFVEKSYELNNYIDSSDIDKVRSFNSLGEVSLPAFCFKGTSLVVNYNLKFSSYKYSYKVCKDLSEVGAMPNSGLAYLTGYDWSKLNFSGVMGVLATLCLEKDINAIPTESNMFGYWDIYQLVVPSCRPFEKEKSLALSSEISSQKRRIIAFLTTIGKVHNVKFDDPNLLNQYITGLSDDTSKQLSIFLSASDPSQVSSEAYAAFRNSKFGLFQELDIVRFQKKKFNLMDADDDKAEAKETEEQNPSSDAETPNDKDQGTTPDSDEKDAPSNDESGNQDSPDDISKDAESSDNQPDAQEPKDSQNKLPPLPKLDDKKGIKLQLSAGESASTVLYRDELNTYLTNLLANPPPQLSAQTILALKRLRAYWLHILSVKDLHDFVSAMIKLPKSISLNNKR